VTRSRLCREEELADYGWRLAFDADRRGVAVANHFVRTTQSRTWDASSTRRLVNSTPRTRNLIVSQVALLGVPPPKPNVRNRATANRNTQIRLKGRKALKPAVINRISGDLKRRGGDGPCPKRTETGFRNSGRRHPH
jgi:hypothetical protein